MRPIITNIIGRKSCYRRTPGAHWQSTRWRARGTALVLLAATFVAAGAVAQVWAQHRFIPPTCKTPEVYKEIADLKVKLERAKGIWDRAIETATTDDRRLENCLEAHKYSLTQKADCAPAEQAKASSEAAKWKAYSNYYSIDEELEDLEELPECPVTPQTPPPPPPHPQPQPQPQPGPVIHPPGPGVTATHRETACPRCQPIAAKLNQAADNYAQAVNRHDPDQTVFRQQMSEYSNELDQCERQCAPGGNVPGITAPPGPRPGAR